MLKPELDEKKGICQRGKDSGFRRIHKARKFGGPDRPIGKDDAQAICGKGLDRGNPHR
jgi:hypothetical protein